MAELVWFNNRTYFLKHGNPFDRGMADSHYKRPRDPHYMAYNEEGDCYREEDLDSIQTAEYNAGYDFNEYIGDWKEYD